MKQWLRFSPIVIAAGIILSLTLLDSSKNSTDHEHNSTSAATHQHLPIAAPPLTETNASTSPDFANWLIAWQNASSPAAREALLEQGLTLAMHRHEVMRQLMRQHPDAALAQAISYSDYATLPDALKPWVEEPFSSAGLLDVQITCSQHEGSHQHYTYENQTGQRWNLSMPAQHRVTRSKRGLPVQGIRLDSIAVIRGSVFQTLSDADTQLVASTWPSGQQHPDLCYATGQPIEGDGITAVAGGRVYHFQDTAALESVESALSSADALPGLDVGSQWILREVLADSFLFTQFALESETAAFSSTTGAKTAFFILVDFPDILGAPVASATLEQVIDLDVNNALDDYSYGLTSMDATIASGIHTVLSNSDQYLNDPDDGNASTKDYGHLYSEALAAYIGAGNADPRSTYDTVGIYFTDVGFSWSGLASVGGQKMWLENSTSSKLILHELGHNYGLKHANYWAFDYSNGSSTNPVDPTGASQEYGDVTDTMGGGSIDEGHFHMAAKQELSWLAGNQWQDLSSNTDNGNYRIYRFDQGSATGNQALRIAKAATSEHYWLGYRKEHESLTTYSHGAQLLWERDTSPSTDRNQSWLIDTTPGSADGKDDAPLALGRTYADTASDVYMTVTAVSDSSSDEYIDVVINFGPFAGNSAPTANLYGPTSTAARQNVLFSANASDSDGDTLAYAWDLGDGSIPTNSDTITHSWSSAGTYTVSLTVSDMKGGSTTVSQNVTVNDPLATWTDRSSGATETLNAIAANSTYAVAVGDSPLSEVGDFARILRSSDGITWTNYSPSGSVLNLNCRDAIWDGTEFLIAGYDYDFGINAWEGVIYTSPDGQTWTRAYETNTADTRLRAIASNGSGTVVAVGDNGTVVSLNSGTWSIVNTGVASTKRLQDIAYGEGTFIFVGYNYDTVSPSYNGNVEVRRSSDGLSWTDDSTGTGLSSWKDLRSIDYTGDHFVASGFYAGILHSTDQGQTWTPSTPGDYYELEGFAATSGLVYAVGTNDDASGVDVDLISSDGITWTEIDPGNLDDRHGVTDFANTFITVGDNGTIRQSGTLTESTVFSDYISTYYSGTDSESTANPDGDWANNLIEYALGSLPNSNASSPTAPSLTIDGTGHIVFEVDRTQQRPDIAYSIWWSTNLSDWTQAGLTVETDDATTLKVRSTGTTTTETKAFFKLLLSQ